MAKRTTSSPVSHITTNRRSSHPRSGCGGWCSGDEGAGRGRIGDYELVRFDLPADPAGATVIGWEVFGPPRHEELIDHGDAQTFEDAKAAAKTAFAKL